MSEFDAVAVVSGGMDSTTMLHYLVKKQGLHPALLTFAYGQRHVREIDCARAQAALLGLPAPTLFDLTPFKAAFASSALVDADREIPQAAEVEGDPQPATYVPFRNLIFLSLAAAFAESHAVNRVYYGAQRHDLYGYWDTTPDFLARVNHVFALNRKNEVSIEAPFVNYSKADILRLGFEMGVDYGQTWSCYYGGAVACGNCPTCAERLKAFAEVGVADPLPYALSLPKRGGWVGEHERQPITPLFGGGWVGELRSAMSEAGIYTISKQFEFSAAHHLAGLGDGHPCARNHGHNYVVEVTLAATTLDERGFIKDYGELAPIKDYLNQNLDHQDLNAVLNFQPSAENLARYLFELWQDDFPQLVLVRVSETARTWASYGLELASWLEMTKR